MAKGTGGQHQGHQQRLERPGEAARDSARPTRATLDFYGTRGAFAADLFHDYVFFRDGTASRRSKLTRPLRDGAGHFGHACLNLAGRALRRETAYPGLSALCARVYASLDGGAPAPILPGQILEVAALRDDFLARTSETPPGTPPGTLP